MFQRGGRQPSSSSSQATPAGGGFAVGRTRVHGGPSVQDCKDKDRQGGRKNKNNGTGNNNNNNNVAVVVAARSNKLRHREDRPRRRRRCSQSLAVTGLGLMVIVATFVTAQVIFWMKQYDETMGLSSVVMVGNPVAGNMNHWRQQQQQKQQQQHTPPQNNSTTRMTWKTLSFPSKTPVYRPQTKYDVDYGLLYQRAPDLDQLPQWIRDYVTWHAQQRRTFPGMKLFTDPHAPCLLIRTCLGLCGGLHDRIGQLPWDLYLAAKTKRILLMAWQRPKALEYFLQPSLSGGSPPTMMGGGGRGDGDGGDQLMLALDWTVPYEARFGFDDIRRVRNETQLFEGYNDAQPEEDFFTQHLDMAIERATSGAFRTVRVLRHRLLGHLYQDVLEQRLEQEGWYKTDRDIADGHTPARIHQSPTFGHIFHLFFRPSDAIHDLIVHTMGDLGLLTTNEDSHSLSLGPYHAVHCRVRHPKAHAKGQVVKGKNANYPADKTGLPWDVGSPTRQFAIETANLALECARKVVGSNEVNSENQHGPIYFLADSNDLVRHVATELHDPQYLQVNASQIDPNLLRTVQSLEQAGVAPVARNVEMETAHIDRQKGRDPPAYYATLVDLYIAMHARCVVYGIGYYAAFAAKISGTQCQYLYAEEAWGAQTSKTSAVHGAQLCPNVVSSGSSGSGNHQ